MITVLFNIESHYRTDRKKIKQAIEKSLVGQVRRDCEVSVSIIGDRLMHRLNRDYRKIDSTTDVLSFPLNADPRIPGRPFVDVPDGVLRLGDILISYPMAVMEAGEQNKMVDDMIIELVIHGLNHLLGIHHPSE